MTALALSPLLLGSAASAAEGPRQETNTVCTGGATDSDGAYSGGTARYLLASLTGTGKIDCPIPARAAGTDTVIRLYGRKVGTSAVTWHTGDALAPQQRLSYAGVTPAQQQVLLGTSPVLPSGPASSFQLQDPAGDSYVLDFYTVDTTPTPAPSPTPTPTPTPTTPPATTEPTPAPSASSPAPAPASSGPVTLDSGQFGVLALGGSLGLMLLSATFVAQLRRPS